MISGGENIENWTLHDGKENIWKADIKDMYSRQIWYNDGVETKKAIRSRSADNFMLAETTRGYIRTCGDIDFSAWDDILDLEVVSNIYWTGMRIPVANACNNLLIIDEHLWAKLHQRWKGYGESMIPCRWIENNYNLIDMNHEWFIDRSEESNVIYYKFPANTSPTDFEIIIPLIDVLIYGENMSNTIFNNLQFSFTSWLRPSDFVDDYANNGLFHTPTSSYNRNNGLRIKYGDKYIDYIDRTAGYYDYLKLIPSALSFKRSSNVQIINNP